MYLSRSLTVWRSCCGHAFFGYPPVVKWRYTLIYWPNVYTSSFPHLFPLSCGVDVSYETPPSSSVLSVLPGQFFLGQVVPDAIQPPPLWSSSPSFPRHLHRHHSLAYVFVFSSQYVPIPLQPTPEASGNRGGWVEFLQRSSAGRVFLFFFIFYFFYFFYFLFFIFFRITIISWKEFVSFLRTKFEGYWETIVTKVHSQTLMAMKSGCKIYTQNVT